MCEKYRIRAYTPREAEPPALVDIVSAIQLESIRYAISQKAATATALYALGRLLPRPCNLVTDRSGAAVYLCPACGDYTADGPFCPHCGQRLGDEGAGQPVPMVMERTG